MNNLLTLGSLFDGSGSFPVAGLLSGIKPVWKSEIEPFVIAVTNKRLPQMKHYGDIKKINGAEIEPVDVITFGSPCTDLSIAGKRAGLNAERSGLFFHAVRVIREMRVATNGKYPKFIVWENVTGAFSSQSGEDFRTVLEEICKIKDCTVSVPRPERWSKSGCIMADGFSLASRTLDAQYWGVPQRRKRIYLVADFDGERAGKILFKSEGVSGYSAESFRTWQNTACRSEVRTGTADTGLMFENHSQDTRYTGPLEVAPAVLSTYGTGGNNQPFIVNTQTFGICAKKSHSMLSDNPHSGFYRAKTTRTLDTSNQSPCKNQGGIVVLEENHTVAFSQDSYDKYSENKKSGSLMACGGAYGGGSEVLVYSTSKDSFHMTANENIASTLVASDYKDPPTVAENPLYKVRRLTPPECALLQGMPSWWCKGLETENPTEDNLKFWRDVFETHRKATNPDKKPKSDSAEYKMWGNGIAMPCAWFVLAGITHFSD